MTGRKAYKIVLQYTLHNPAYARKSTYRTKFQQMGFPAINPDDPGQKKHSAVMLDAACADAERAYMRGRSAARRAVELNRQ